MKLNSAHKILVRHTSYTRDKSLKNSIRHNPHSFNLKCFAERESRIKYCISLLNVSCMDLILTSILVEFLVRISSENALLHKGITNNF